MDYDLSQQKKLNQFAVEAKRWKKTNQEQAESPAKRGRKVQPAKRKKRSKK
tara:strand:- start:255 stop:407 length:153 start_codon:yes stop_codon:yes gene_type:complete